MSPYGWRNEFHVFSSLPVPATKKLFIVDFSCMWENLSFNLRLFPDRLPSLRAQRNLFPSPRRKKGKYDERSKDWKWKLCSFKDVIMHHAWFYVMKPCIINIIIFRLSTVTRTEDEAHFIFALLKAVKIVIISWPFVHSRKYFCNYKQ